MNTRLGSLMLLLFSTALLTTATQLPQSWAASDGTWLQLAPSGTPPVKRADPLTVYDSVHDRLIVFGGHRSGSPYMDVWTLPLGGPLQWTELAPTGSPPSPRVSNAAIYDPVRDRMIIFGGFCRSCDVKWYNDVWALSLGATPGWTQLMPGGTLPSTRSSDWAIYDPVRDRMVMFGGEEGSGGDEIGHAVLNEVWELSLATPQWTQLAPAGTAPSGRYGSVGIYDPLRDRVVLFGGNDLVSGLYNDVWALSLGASPHWTELAPQGVLPAPRLMGSAIHDPTRDRMVAFGGSVGASIGVNDVWALSLGETPRWTALAPLAPPPSGRYAHGAIYDPLRDRMFVVGGEAGYANYQNDVWALDWYAGHASLQCPADVMVPGLSTIQSLSLVGFRITNAGATPNNFAYSVSAQGPATLVDKGDPAAISGITPLLGPGASYYPPEAGLIIPAIRDHVEQHVAYHVADATNSSCTTTIVLEPPVPVFITAFDANALDEGVRLTWAVYADEDASGFKLYRGVDGGLIRNEIPSAGLIPSDARSYTDAGVSGGITYQYTLGVVLADGSEVRSPIVTVRTKPVVLALDQNIPNPFNPTTTIAFTLPGRSRVTLSIYDVEGRLVRTLVDDSVGEGRHAYTWDGKNASGRSVSSGAYFYSLTADDRRITKKMVLLK